MLVVGILLFAVRISNLVVHSFGCYTLIIQYRTTRKTVQQFLMINLSLTELIQNVLATLTTPIYDMNMDIPAKLAEDMRHVQDYIVIVYEMMTFNYYTSIIYITCDRLLAVRLSLKYRLYCTLSRTL